MIQMARGPDHQVCNYPGGPKLAKIDEKNSQLTDVLLN